MTLLYFVPNDPCKSVIVSSNGTAQYRITTTRKHVLGAPLLQIHRPMSSAARESYEPSFLVAEIEWKRWSQPVVRSSVFDGRMHEIELRDFLYELGARFST